VQSAISIEVQASGQAVFDLARDLSRWADLLPHHRRVTVQSHDGDRTMAQMVAVRHFGPLPVPVTWRAEQWPDATDPADLRLHFRHVRGITRGMVVTWHILPNGRDGSTVTIEHDFARRLPLVGPNFLPAIVDRYFTRHIAGRTLATFKRLAEAASDTTTGTG
jgi:aromatase